MKAINISMENSLAEYTKDECLKNLCRCYNYIRFSVIFSNLVRYC